MSDPVIFNEPVIVTVPIIVLEPLINTLPVIVLVPISVFEPVIISEPVTVTVPITVLDPVMNTLPVIVLVPISVFEPVIISEPVIVVLPLKLFEPVIATEPDTLTFLSESTANIIVLPDDTDSKFEVDDVTSVIENILLLLPDTPNIVDPLPISCNALVFADADITVLPVTVNELKLAVSV